jgi:chemotaxis protein CheY-P-specific phosphatase CheC
LNIKEILLQKDEILKAHSEDAAKKMAHALSDISGESVKVEKSVVDVVELGRIKGLYDSPNGKVLLIKLNIQGKLKGEFFVIPTAKDAGMLAEYVASRRTEGEVNENVKNSVMGEIGNILAATYIGAIGRYFSDILMPSVPRLTFLESYDFIQKYVSENTDISSRALMLACDLIVGNSGIRLPILLLLNPESIDTFIGNA